MVALITAAEIFDMIAMTAFVGFIFMDVFKSPVKEPSDIIKQFSRGSSGFDWENFKFAAMVTAPAIILHELGHKFVATGFGLTAQFHAAYGWLALGLILKLMRTGFIFFVPAYVSIFGAATSAQFSLTAFAGPAVNLLLWIGATIAIKKNWVKQKHMHFAVLTQKINMFLFIFNMLPIPGFDGSKVFAGLAQAVL